MVSLDGLKKGPKNTSSGKPSKSPADKLADMRPQQPLPGREILHAMIPSVGRPITENDQSLEKIFAYTEEDDDE